MSLFGNIFGQSDRQITDPHVREHELIERIQAIDLTGPRKQLSDEKIRELNLAGVIRFASTELRYPAQVDETVRKLDRDLERIIRALGEAVANGYELTAQWAGNALTFAIKNLRTDLSDLDRDTVEAAMKCRVEYSENLRLLVELCRDYDNLSIGLQNLRRRRQEKRRELDTAKLRCLTRMESGELDMLLLELQEHIHDPGAIGEDAQNLRDELSRLHLLKAALIELDISINVDQVALNNREAQIETRRNAMMNPPQDRDPKLQERINEADRIYREKLQRDLDVAEEAIRSYAIHVQGMSELAGQGVNLAMAAKALETEEQLQVERYTRMLEESAF